ncbi:unnamed protein product [Merluccius merluccius]
MAEEKGWDAETSDPEEAPKKTGKVELDNWDDEDVDDDTKDTWDEEEAELKREEQKKAETAKSEKKKLSDKIKEKELSQRLEEQEDGSELTPEEGSEAGGQQPDVKQANEATGWPLNDLKQYSLKHVYVLSLCSAPRVTGDSTGIDAMSPSSKDDFGEFEKLLKDKLCPYEKSAHYSGFLESLFQDLCISLEIEDLKKINSSITVLLGEKQKQEKQLNKGKKKKKGAVTAGGLKAKMKDDLADYGQFEGGYTQDYEDFM